MSRPGRLLSRPLTLPLPRRADLAGVAGLMAVVALGVDSFSEVFADFRTGTGLFPTSRFDLPSEDNPRLAGGMHWTAVEYMEFLRSLYLGQSLTPELRTALAAIDNAEAVDSSFAPDGQSSTIAGAVVGLGAGEVARRTLSDDDVRAILRDAITEREEAAAEYEARQRPEDAARLRTEAGILTAILADS